MMTRLIIEVEHDKGGVVDGWLRSSEGRDITVNTGRGWAIEGALIEVVEVRA